MTIIFFFDDFSSGITALACMMTLPFPVSYADLIPFESFLSIVIIPAVGKSGPSMYFIISEIFMSGFLVSAINASITSLRLCGGIFVAMPTAMPEEPFMSKLGIRVGKTTGSISFSS